VGDKMIDTNINISEYACNIYEGNYNNSDNKKISRYDKRIQTNQIRNLRGDYMENDREVQRDLRYRDKVWLYEQYINQKKSTEEIAEICECDKSTICKWRNKFNIKKEKPKYQNKEWLKDQYLNLKKTTPQIAKICNTTPTPIQYWLRKFNIEIRNSSERHKGQVPWNKGLKGYLGGEKHYNWNGGRINSKEGYIYIHNSNHPHVTKRNYVFEHILIMEKEIERYLWRWEVIHHINEIKNDNRIENLFLCKNSSHHRKIHKQFTNICMELFRSGKFNNIMIKFNKDKGKYYIEYKSEVERE
jgi:hypothetical protein